MLDLLFDIAGGILEEFILEALSESFRSPRKQKDAPSKSVLGLI
jgi:hypothetical protein